jgi:hypothetical protein
LKIYDWVCIFCNSKIDNQAAFKDIANEVIYIVKSRYGGTVRIGQSPGLTKQAR